MDLQFETLDLEQDGRWLTVWFNDPDKRNPLTNARFAEMLELCTALKTSDIRGVTFRGRGGWFCAGGDLSMFRAIVTGELQGAALEDFSRNGAQLFDAIAQLPQVTVTVAEGAAMAGGLGILCMTDIVIAEEKCRFGLSEVRRGLVAAQIAPFVVDRIGRRLAKRLMVLGAPFDAMQAHGFGLADYLVTADQINDTLNAIRAEVAQTSPEAVAGTKELLMDLHHLTRAQQIDKAARIFTETASGADGREGLTAFAQKRAPRWSEEPC